MHFRAVGIVNVPEVLEIISSSVAEAVLPCADSKKSFEQNYLLASELKAQVK